MKLLIKNQNFIIKSFFLAVVILMTVITVCSASDTNIKGSSVEKVEVYHFHPTHGCYTCTTMGKNAEDTVQTNFQDELESGKIVFNHINFQDPANTELVKKYEVTGSSLMIGVYDQNGFHKEENMKVWYLAGKKDESMTYLKELIKKRLSGDFSE